jgi:hypothetical protein
MENLFKLLKAIYGENVIAKTIGTRTNVIKLPSVKNNPTIKAFDMEAVAAEGPKKIQLAKDAIEEQIPYISKMNDSERLMFEGNVRRLHDVINPPSAEVVTLTTKQPVTGEGLLSLTKEAGQINPPGTMVGDIESKVNKLKSLSKELEKTTGEKVTLGDILGEFGKSQSSYEQAHKEGLVRATAREIIGQDLKSGKLKTLTKEELNSVDPIDIYRRHYGEGALEQLDSLAPEFNKLRTEKEAADLVKSKYIIEPKASPSREYLTDEEVKGLDYLTGQGPEKKAKGGRIGYADGTPVAGMVSLPDNPISPLVPVAPTGKVLKPEYRNGIPLGLPMDSYYMDAPSVTNSSSNLDSNTSLKDQYLNRLAALQSSSPFNLSYQDFKNLLQSKLEGKAQGGIIRKKYGHEGAANPKRAQITAIYGEGSLPKEYSKGLDYLTGK